MKRPSFQFYPADWRNNANLRRCSHAARGAWMDVLSLLHDSDEYGIVRWPLAEIANAASIPMKLIKELVEKQVLKGSDSELKESYIYIPRSGRKEGDPVTLVPEQGGPIWFSSRFVRDEYKRQNSGKETRFGADEKQEKHSLRRSPSRRHGANQGDGSTSSSSTSLSSDDDNSTSPSSSPPRFSEIEPYLSLDQNKARCLADENVNGFVSVVTAGGMKREYLPGWLGNFNKKLTSEGTTSKAHKDYRKHFFGWIKFQDYGRGDPASYKPLQDVKSGSQENSSDYLSQRRKNEEKTRRLSQ